MATRAGVNQEHLHQVKHFMIKIFWILDLTKINLFVSSANRRREQVHLPSHLGARRHGRQRRLHEWNRLVQVGEGEPGLVQVRADRNQ